jgi:nicotinate-nucleotide pyrophosphorylase (carboxylating)
VVAPLDPAVYRDIVRQALEEDLGGRVSLDADVTTAATVDAKTRARGVFLAKAPCVIAGLPIAFEAFRLLEPSVEAAAWCSEGEAALAGQSIGAVTGTARALLVGERTALNFLQRLSGIATCARAFVDAAAWRIALLDTRKTTPTLRALEKYAVRVGGATNHRVGLHDAVLIKDNHVRLAGGVAKAVAAVRAAQPGWPIEVEAQSLAEVDEALAAGVETILVDNLPLAEIRRAVAAVAGRARVEISGGVTLDQLPALAETGADCVSVGALTHSAPAVDISFELTRL